MATPIAWLLVILAATIVGVVALRSFSRRARIAFDILCFAGLSAILHADRLSPFLHGPATSTDAPTMWLRLTALAWWLLGARVLVAILYFAFQHDHRRRETRLFIDLIAAAIYICTGLIVIKSVLAFPLGGVLATSGIVAIVLGLAMQNTLADVFAGIAVGIEAPFQVGDRVSLGKNTEGQVVEMNWRSVRIQTDGADIAVVPNSVVSKLEILNRSVPTRTRSDSVRLWCPATADPGHVIDALRQAILLCPEVLGTPAAAVSLTHFGPTCHGYTVSFSVADTPHLSSTKSLLLQKAHRQLRYGELLAANRSARTGSAREIAARRVLKDLVLFESLAPEQIEALAEQTTASLLEPEEILFSQGSADSTLYVVGSGILEVTRTTESGGVVTLGRLGAGEYLGEIGLLTGAPHPAAARALTHCHVHRLSRQAIAPLLAAHPDMLAAFDKSVRRGMDLLHANVAASTSEALRHRGELLARIREFFGFGPLG